MAEDSKLWDIICDGHYIPTKVLEELSFSMSKTSKEYTDIDRKAVEKNFRAKKILECGIGLEEYNRISAYDTAKEIWKLCKQLMREPPKMKDDESIQHMHTRFISIITELHSLGETIPRNKLVRKILSILPSPWESKVNAIIESKDLQELTIEELVGNLKTYKMKRKIESERREPKKEKNMVLKDDSNDSSEEDSDMAYFTKNNPEKASMKNPVPFKNFKRKISVDNVMKQALAAWEDSSSESEDKTDAGDSSMMAVEASVLIDAYHSLVEDRYSLTLELGEAEQTRDDLVVVVIDHKETIENFKEERNDLLEVIADLREIIERPETNSKPGNSGKGKEIASEEHIRLKNELKAVRTRMCVETEKNKHLQTHLERVKNDLEKFLKWTWSSEVVTAMYINNGGNRHGIWFQRKKTPYNPHSKYVIVSDNSLCTHYGNNGHFKENFQARVQSVQKNKVFAEKVTTKEGPVKGSSQQWFMDSGCSKHMTGNTMDFLSLKALQGGSVSLGNRKKGYILGVGKVEKSPIHSIENVYYVNGLKYSLLSVS
ncbi:uncharacterized protein [Nicotiana sylvestris]|uniref:uncharacterized protein n=1 Tax=Nicotiana sylvestris TaxID=4096 RepID=UPI00388C652B